MKNGKLTLAEAVKKIAALKRELTTTRNRLVRERDAECDRADSAETYRDSARWTCANALKEVERLESERAALLAQVAQLQRDLFDARDDINDIARAAGALAMPFVSPSVDQPHGGA